MASDEVRRHLRAALDAAVAEEKARIRDIFKQRDAQTERWELKLGPIVDALRSLKDEIGPFEGLNIMLPPSSPGFSVESYGDSRRFDLSTNLDVTSFEIHETYFLSDPDDDHAGERIHRFVKPDETLQFIVKVIGQHIANGKKLHPRHR